MTAGNDIWQEVDLYADTHGEGQVEGNAAVRVIDEEPKRGHDMERRYLHFTLRYSGRCSVVVNALASQPDGPGSIPGCVH